MDCAQCGSVVPPGRSVCPTCGAPTTSAATAASTATLDALLAEANLYRTRSQYDLALSTCTRVLQSDPTNAPAHSLIANIYRDQGNYREALNWFKLAVNLNPDNEDDNRKLKEMIDKVFQGVIAGGPSAQAARPQAAAPAKKLNAMQRVLTKLQPVHIVIAITVLVVGLSIPIILWQQQPPPRRTSHNRSTVDETDHPVIGTDIAQNASGSAVVQLPTTGEMGTTTPSITPPQPDGVESGDARPVPGLPGIVVRPGGQSRPRPNTTATTSPTLTEPTPTATTPPDASVPPLNPLEQGDAGSADEIELQTMLLKMSLDNMLAKSKLPSKLDSLYIDPRTNALTVKYIIPSMTSTVQAKQGLLYTGLHLAWSASDQNKSLTSFTLRGYAEPTPGRDATLAFVADLSLQQAREARQVTDYRAVQSYLSNIWWRTDLKDVTL